MSLKRVLVHLVLSIKYFLYLVWVVKKGDLLLVPSRPPELIFCAWLLKKLKGVHVHMDITDLWPDMLKAEKNRRFRLFSIYCCFLQRLSIRSFDSFTHISPCAVPWLARYAPDKVSSFIPLGYDAQRWKDVTLADKFQKEIRFVYVGTLTYHFDIRPFLRAIVGRDSLVLTIIGDGDYFDEIQAFVESHDMTNVVLRGSISPKEVVKALQDQDVGLSPEISDVSVIPNKVFDYIASYCPLLVFGENDTAQFVRAANIGWTLPFEEEAVSAFLDEISFDDVRRKVSRLAELRKDYSKETLYGEFVDVLSQNVNSTIRNDTS